MILNDLQSSLKTINHLLPKMFAVSFLVPKLFKTHSLQRQRPLLEQLTSLPELHRDHPELAQTSSLNRAGVCNERLSHPAGPLDEEHEDSFADALIVIFGDVSASESHSFRVFSSLDDIRVFERVVSSIKGVFHILDTFVAVWPEAGVIIRGSGLA